MTIRKLLFLTLFSMLLPTSVTAQTARYTTDRSSTVENGTVPEPQIYRIEIHVFKPGGEAVYETAVKSLVQGLAAARIKLASWDFSVATDGGSTYLTIDPMPNWSMLDHFQADGAAFEKAMPEVWAAFRRDVRSVRERETDFFMQTEPNADDPGALGEDGRDFLHVEVFYPKDSPGVLTALNSLKKLYAPSAPGLGSRVYLSVTGDDLPFFWFVRSAKDRKGYFAAEGQVPAATRASIEKLFEKAHQESKRVQTMDLMIRQDLSYRVSQVAEAKR